MIIEYTLPSNIVVGFPRSSLKFTCTTSVVAVSNTQVWGKDLRQVSSKCTSFLHVAPSPTPIQAPNRWTRSCRLLESSSSFPQWILTSLRVRKVSSGDLWFCHCLQRARWSHLQLLYIVTSSIMVTSTFIWRVRWGSRLNHYRLYLLERDLTLHK